MTKTEITKKIAKFVVGTSVGFTVANVLRNNVYPEKTHHKVESAVGSVVVGMMAAGAAESWTDRQIDAIVASWNKAESEKTSN